MGMRSETRTVLKGCYLTWTMSSFKDIVIGSVCVTIGQLFFATNDSIVKYCIEFNGLKESQLLLGRFGIQFIIAIIWWIAKKPPKSHNWYGDQPYIPNIWARGFLYSINVICAYYAFIRLPVGDAIAIFLQSPIVTSIIAWIFLGEKLPKTTPLICILGSVGIVFISQPSFLISLYRNFSTNEAELKQIETLNIDGLISIIVALCAWSIANVLVRTAKEAHFLQLEIVNGGQTIFISLPALLLSNKLIMHNIYIGGLDVEDWFWDLGAIGYMLILGIFGFVALQCIVIGFQYADATKVAWLEYIIIVFSFAYQIFLFNDIPNELEIIGVGFVMLAAILSLLEELYYFVKTKDAISYDEVN